MISDKKEALNCLDIPRATNLFDEIEIGSQIKLNETFKKVNAIKIFKSIEIPLTIPQLKIKLPKVRIKIMDRPNKNNGMPASAQLMPDLVYAFKPSKIKIRIPPPKKDLGP